LYIHSLSALIRDEKTNTFYPWDKCFQRFSTEDKLNNHIKNYKCISFVGESLKIIPSNKNYFFIFYYI
jgi:hypothetical protein